MFYAFLLWQMFLWRINTNNWHRIYTCADCANSDTDCLALSHSLDAALSHWSMSHSTFPLRMNKIPRDMNFVSWVNSSPLTHRELLYFLLFSFSWKTAHISCMTCCDNAALLIGHVWRGKSTFANIHLARNYTQLVVAFGLRNVEIILRVYISEDQICEYI